MDSVTGSVTNPKLPEDEAPPPYTPPRLLTDSHKSNNMQCIAEGPSEEDEYATSHDENVGGESASQTDNVISVLPAKPVRTIEQSPYDTHMAFMRSPPTHSSTLGGIEYDSHAAFTRPQVDEKSPSKIEQDIPPHALKPSSPSAAVLGAPDQLEYDTHAAFARRSDRSKFFNKRISMPVMSSGINVDTADITTSSHQPLVSTGITSSQGMSAEPTNSAADKSRKLSPHTPPGMSVCLSIACCTIINMELVVHILAHCVVV